jgi:hypothetical protein
MTQKQSSSVICQAHLSETLVTEMVGERKDKNKQKWEFLSGVSLYNITEISEYLMENIKKFMAHPERRFSAQKDL